MSNESNPFSTRYVRPGALRYEFPPGIDAGTLVGRIEKNQWWGQIVGPHGSGKTTLIETLIPELQRAGRLIQRFTLRAQDRRPYRRRFSNCRWDPDTVAIVDGYQQLSAWNRFQLRTSCRRARCGLLVTAHQSLGLPHLINTRADLDTAGLIVQQLLADEPGILSHADVAECFRQQHGNCREMLFALYDLYQQRQWERGQVC